MRFTDDRWASANPAPIGRARRQAAAPAKPSFPLPRLAAPESVSDAMDLAAVTARARDIAGKVALGPTPAAVGTSMAA